MNLYYARHGEGEGNSKGTMMGQLDLRLTQLGKEQAKVLGERIKEIEPTLIVSSPLLRAYETAQIVAQTIGYKKTIIQDARLKERNMGVWQGKQSVDFYAKLEAVGEEELQKFSKMEGLEELRDRCLSFASWLEEQTEDCIVIVGHHAYSKMFRTVVSAPEEYKSAFVRELPRIETGGYVKINMSQGKA